MKTTSTFLMFEGRAEEAMNFYVSLFEDGRVEEVRRYEAGGAGREGSVMYATFTLNGSRYRCIDSAVAHGFTFTPATSIYVTCSSEAEVETLYAQLAEGGAVMMPLGVYPFSNKFGWVADRFGVSWQITLEKQ